MKNFLFVIFCLILFTVTPNLSADDLIVTGSDKTLWIVETIEPYSQHPDASTDEVYKFHVVARQLDGKFKWTVRNVKGMPLAADAAGEQLKLFTSHPNGYFIISEQTQNITPGVYPREIISKETPNIAAICSTDKFGKSGQPATILAIKYPQLKESATQPATAQHADAIGALTKTLAQEPAGKYDVSLKFFALQQGKWQQFAELKNSGLDHSPLKSIVEDTDPKKIEQKVSILYNEGKLFVSIGGPTYSALHTFADDQWSHLPLFDANLLSVLKVRDIPVILSVEEPEDQVQKGFFVRINPIFSTEEGFLLNQNGIPFLFKNQPQYATGFGNSIAIIAGQDRKSFELTLCEVSGNLIKTEPIAIFTKTPPKYTIVDIQQYYLWGALLVSVAAVVAGKFKPEPQPFAFPFKVRPAPLFKRLAAALIDLAPFIFAASFIVQFFITEEALKTLENLPDIGTLIKEPSIIPIEFSYFLFGAFTLWAIYCCLMEWKYGWTLGKRLMKLSVITDPSRTLTFRQCVLRNSMKLVEVFMPLGLPLLGIIVIINPLHLRIGDILAKTFVCDASKPIEQPETEKKEEQQAD